MPGPFLPQVGEATGLRGSTVHRTQLAQGPQFSRRAATESSQVRARGVSNAGVFTRETGFWNGQLSPGTRPNVDSDLGLRQLLRPRSCPGRCDPYCGPGHGGQHGATSPLNANHCKWHTSHSVSTRLNTKRTNTPSPEQASPHHPSPRRSSRVLEPVAAVPSQGSGSKDMSCLCCTDESPFPSCGFWAVSVATQVVGNVYDQM